MLTPEQQNNIREEAEKKYPDSNFEWVNRIIEARLDTYIDTATLYQERINGLVEALEGIQKFYGRLTNSEIQQIVTNTLNNYYKSHDSKGAKTGTEQIS